jgi:hypothetical protein
MIAIWPRQVGITHAPDRLLALQSAITRAPERLLQLQSAITRAPEALLGSPGAHHPGAHALLGRPGAPRSDAVMPRCIASSASPDREIVFWSCCALPACRGWTPCRDKR